MVSLWVLVGDAFTHYLYLLFNGRAPQSPAPAAKNCRGGAELGATFTRPLLSKLQRIATPSACLELAT
jgi:hypothetical protein